MPYLVGRIRDFVVLAAMLLIAFLFMLNANEPLLRGFRKAALEITGNVERRIAWVAQVVFAISDNARLRRANVQLTSDLARLHVADLENARLRELLALKADSVYQVVPARIVARDPYGQTNFFTLDAGQRDGVAVDMAVIDENGILGRVVHTSARYSRVMPYLNTEFHVPAMIEPLFAVGMISWPGSHPDVLVLENVVQTVPVKIGQSVVTHEASGIFPPNVPVGTVSAVRSHPGLNAWDIEVRPAAPLHSTRFAFVVQRIIDAERLALEAEPMQ